MNLCYMIEDISQTSIEFSKWCEEENKRTEHLRNLPEEFPYNCPMAARGDDEIHFPQ